MSSVSRVKILGRLFGSGTMWKRPPPASATLRNSSWFTPSPKPTVVDRDRFGQHTGRQIFDALNWRLTVGQQHDVLFARLHDR